MPNNNDVVRAKTADDFTKAYEALCKEYGFFISVIPMWIIRDDGTWSTKLQASLGQLPKEK